VDLFERTTAYELFTATAQTTIRVPEPKRKNEDSSSQKDGSIHESIAESTPSINGVSSTGGEEEAGDVSADHPDSSAQAELEMLRRPSEMEQQSPVVTGARRRFFNRIITNCVLQLLMIETVHELFSNDAVYSQIPSNELLRLMGLLKKSYQFAKRFNEAKELRVQLWKQGFMKQPPNLLKQESGSAATYVSILFRMYHDDREERRNTRVETEEALIP
jgi:brefeldin A-inhibited guanine nucleotide-exchange protein